MAADVRRRSRRRRCGLQTLAPPRRADSRVSLQRLLAQRRCTLGIAKALARPGERVVGDAVEHDGARVDHGPAGVRQEERGDRRHQPVETGRQRDVEKQVEDQEVVVVAGQVRQDPVVEGRREPTGIVRQPELEVDPRDLGVDLTDPFAIGDRLGLARAGDD